MSDFIYLSEEEIANLSNKERRDYLNQKRAFENSKLISDTLNYSETKEDNNNTSLKDVEPVEKKSQANDNNKPENKSINKQAPKQVQSTLKKENKLADAILMPVEQKQLKTHHKNFLMTEKRYNQFKNLAKERGQSENALFNDILDQLFGEE